jgi:hypothetical protein
LPRILSLCILSLAVFFAACASGPATTGGRPDGVAPQEVGSRHYRFSDVPVPGHFSLEKDKSFIYETGDASFKVGRLIYTGSGKTEDVVLFYQSEMINSGWKLVRTMEHGVTTMLFEKPGWICSVIVQSSFTSVTVEVQMGPRTATRQ